MSVIIDGSTGMTTNAGGLVNPSTTIDGINYSCRAWVNFNGTGTVAIRGSGNVSSITDNGGTGDYTVNFTTAMPDANYAITGSAEGLGMTLSSNTVTQTTTATGVFVSRNTSFFDRTIVAVAIFR